MPQAATASALVRYFNRPRPAFRLEGFLAMADVDYLEILDWLARNTVAGKRGSTPAEAPAIFERPGIDGVVCSNVVKDFGPDPLEGKSVCAFKLISQFLDKREHSRTKPTQRQRAPPTMICVPPNRRDMLEKMTGLKQLGMVDWQAPAKVYVVEQHNEKFLMTLLDEGSAIYSMWKRER